MLFMVDRASARLTSVDSSPGVTLFTEIVAAPTFILRSGSRRTLAIRVAFAPFEDVIATDPVTWIDEAPADGRARTSTSTSAADPSSLTLGKEPNRPSSRRLR